MSGSNEPYICADSLDNLLREVIKRLHREGSEITATRGANCEICGVLLEILNPRARLSRTESRGTLFSCLAELVWYLSGDNSASVIDYYIPDYSTENSDDGLVLQGGYGPRLFAMRGHTNQINNIIQLLTRKPTSRRAVIQLFNAEDLNSDFRDVPCTCTLQFLLRDGKLNMLTHMRSNDAFIGLPHDVFCFTMLQEIIARTLGAEMGFYKHAVGSLHLYESQVENVEQYKEEGWQKPTSMPEMPEGSPWSSIDSLLNIARRIRNSDTEDLNLEALDIYWRDLANLLLLFHATRKSTKNAEIAEAAAAPLIAGPYEPYVRTRLLLLDV